MSVRDENQLVILLKNSDFHAFKELYLKYHARIYNFCTKTIANREEAKDIVQQVFVALWEQRESIDETKPFISYIYTISRYMLYDAIRKKVHRQAAFEYLINNTRQREETTFDEVIFHELSFFFEEAINRLPEKRKEIFRLNRNEGLTYRQIASLLGISENTVDTQMRKSLQFLKQEYDSMYK